MFIKKSKRGFALLETFLVIAFSMIVAALAVLSIVAYRRDAELNNQISDLQQLVDNVVNSSKTSATWLPINVTDTNVFDFLGQMDALPYSLQSQFKQGQQTYISRLGGSISASVGGITNTQLTVNIGNVNPQDCNRVADALLIPSIQSLSINGTNQPLGPAGNLSARDPTASTYATSCKSDTNSLSFVYLKPTLNIHSNIIDDPVGSPPIITGSGATYQAGVGLVANGNSGYLMQGPGLPLDAGLYQARIYANNVVASVDIELDSVNASGASTPVFYTTDQTSPRGSLVGTSQYIQGLGIVPAATNTASNSQTFVLNFTLPTAATGVNFTVKAANGSAFTIVHWTIYPVNPLQVTPID